MDRSAPGPSPTGSRVKITCGHSDSIMERRNLKSHTNRVNAGLSDVENVAREQRTVTFAVNTLKRSTEPA